MRIELPREFERLGAVRIYGSQKIYELDAGPGSPGCGEEYGVVRRLAAESLYAVQREMVVVVPVRSERLKLIEGVLVGIPQPCPVIVVSNSPRAPIDRFYLEQDSIGNFCQFTRKPVMVVHQKDPQLAAAFAAGGYGEILGEDGLIRDGKAEGMILGTVLARLLGRRYVGFVDADNYLPGAVNEYIREYAAAFLLNEGDHVCARISWHSKPKVVEQALYFAKWGRSSRQCNRVLNMLVSHYTGFETDIIRTGNAGEHALTLDLAMSMPYATGYAVEPFHFVHLLEEYGGILPQTAHGDMRRLIKICQIESRNPHFHAAKGEGHVEDMVRGSLATVYHSPLCPDPLKEEIVATLRQLGCLPQDGLIPPVRIYPNLAQLDLEAFRTQVRELLERRPGAPRGTAAGF